MHLANLNGALAADLLHHVGHTPGAPSAADLTALQRAFLDTVPYENLDIQLGRRTTIDPIESARRIVNGRGGYCFHLNGTFATLLVTLGYDVRLARGMVTGDDDAGLGNHMVVLVRLDGETWLPDVAMGDGYRHPIPLREGTYEQKPFIYALERLTDSRWRFHHDKLATIDGIDFDTTAVPLSTFEPNHAHLSTSPNSSFVRKLVVQQRRRDHTLILRGCVLIRTDGNGRDTRDLLNEEEWWSTISVEFGIKLDGIGSAERKALWKRIKTAHDEWHMAGRRRNDLGPKKLEDTPLPAVEVLSKGTRS